MALNGTPSGVQFVSRLQTPVSSSQVDWAAEAGRPEARAVAKVIAANDWRHDANRGVLIGRRKQRACSLEFTQLQLECYLESICTVKSEGARYSSRCLRG